MAKFVAIGNFKFKGKFFKAGDALPEKDAEGKGPFCSDKELAMLVKEDHVQDESKITSAALGDLERQIAARKAELKALEISLDKKKAEIKAPVKE